MIVDVANTHWKPKSGALEYQACRVRSDQANHGLVRLPDAAQLRIARGLATQTPMRGTRTLYEA